MSLRVYVVAEVRLFREALTVTLGGREEIEVVGATSRRREAVADVERHEPDVVLFDVRTPGAPESIRALAEAAPAPKIVALCVPELEPEVVRCAEAGVAGYVTEEAGLDELVAAIEGAARGELLCSPHIAGALLRRVAVLSAARASDPPVARLTARELDVVALIDRGLSNKEIARELAIELSTVKNHVHNILEKVGARRRSEAAARLRPYAATRPRRRDQDRSGI